MHGFWSEFLSIIGENLDSQSLLSETGMVEYFCIIKFILCLFLQKSAILRARFVPSLIQMVKSKVKKMQLLMRLMMYSQMVER